MVTLIPIRCFPTYFPIFVGLLTTWCVAVGFGAPTQAQEAKQSLGAQAPVISDERKSTRNVKPKKAQQKPAALSGCSNSYGGPRARSGQYICSNRGEILACQCSGTKCIVIPTGSIQCTMPGAIIN